MKKITVISFLLLFTVWTDGKLYGQQDPQYTQYMYNILAVNPAYAGNRGVTSIVGLHRSQWVGLDGAPRSQSLSIHGPLSERLGLGVSVVHDGLGPADETFIQGDFSYTINVGEKDKLSFGLKGGGHILNVNFNELVIVDVGQGFDQTIDNKFSPLLGAGAYYHNNKFYAGISVPNFFTNQHFDESANSNDARDFIARERIHYFGIVGYAFDVNSNLKFKPSALVRAVSGAPLQLDLSANFLVRKKLHLGAAYRWSAAFSGLVGFQLSDAMLVGLSYDRESTDLGNTVYNDGTFEVFLRFELFKEYDQIVTPRFF